MMILSRQRRLLLVHRRVKKLSELWRLWRNSVAGDSRVDGAGPGVDAAG
jgi:hypothetical protein